MLQRSKILLRRRRKLSLLGRCDAGGSAAELAAGTAPHFHKNQRCAIAGNQVDFAEAALPIAGFDLQTLFYEKLGREIFCGNAELIHLNAPLLVQREVPMAAAQAGGRFLRASAPG